MLRSCTVAIYHLSVSSGNKAAGQAAVAKLDYILREGKYGRDRDEVARADSGNMPEWAEDSPRAYWQAADTYERANGRLYRQVEFALPNELGRRRQVEAVRAFAAALTDRDRLPFTWAIHRGKAREPGKPDNPHCHLILSERAGDGIARAADKWFRRANRKHPERGGARKVTATATREWLEDTRALWADIANRALERAGRGERIDELSLKDQLYEAVGEPAGWDPERRDPDTGEKGYWTPEHEARLAELDREPGKHLGPVAAALERKGIPSRRRAEQQIDTWRRRLFALTATLSRHGKALARRITRRIQHREQEITRHRQQARKAPGPTRSRGGPSPSLDWSR